MKAFVSIVVSEAAAVQVCGAYRAESAVYHHYFGMVEPVLEQVDFGSPFHQFVCDVEGGFRRKGNIRYGRYHNLHFRTFL